MTLGELRAKWEARRVEHARLRSLVLAEVLIDDVLADLIQLDQTNALDAVSLKEARLLGGYSIDRLQHLVAAGEIDNVGRKGKPRIRRSDVPVKPGYLRLSAVESQLSARRRIVASVTGNTPE